MKERFKQFLWRVGFGAGQVMVISPGRSYVQPAPHSFRIDSVNLHKDARKVGNDLNMKFKRQG